VRVTVPPVRFVPLIITDIGAFFAAVMLHDKGVTEVICGTMLKVTALLVKVVKPAVVTETVMLRAPGVAVGSIVNVAFTEVAVEVTPVTVMPAGALTVAPRRFVPEMVTVTGATELPDDGEIEVSTTAP